jgi:hypothetical protein
VLTGVLHDAVHFVQKPFAPEAIAHKVREIFRRESWSRSASRLWLLQL